jgi:hypothetical protein
MSGGFAAQSAALSCGFLGLWFTATRTASFTSAAVLIHCRPSLALGFSFRRSALLILLSYVIGLTLLFVGMF